jgi:small subunit ribosomal protein S20
MPNSKQAKKRMRQDEERRQEGRTKATAMKTAIKKVLRAPSADEAKQLLPDAMRRIDKAAKASVIHDNTASRYKSRLARNVAAKS